MTHTDQTIHKGEQTMKTGFLKKVLALALCLCMCVSLLPSRFASAESVDEPPKPDGETPGVIVTQDGEITPDEDWNEVYPFGTFAFGNYQADIAEPGAKTADGHEIPQTILIPMYRLGGTVGKATVRIHYTPVITKDEYGREAVYDYAASGRQDVRIEYENPNPIAAYQQFGVPQKELDTAASEIFVTLPEMPENVEEASELNLRLSAPVDADAYRWQVKELGEWRTVDGVKADELPIRWGDLWNFDIDEWTGLDFRCIYEKDNALFGTVSLLGEVYESPYRDPEPLPDDLVIPDEFGFTALEFEDDFLSCEFELTFADGETVKYIRVTALDDEIPELPEMGLFTILRCEGGAASDTCNTLTLMVSDNDRGEPSELGFTAETVSADRAEGVAKVKVARTGGKTYPVTVHYMTEDGTALTGIDYAKTEGELAFAGSIDEIEIAVPLITNYSTGEKGFSVVLSDVRGGGTDDLCTLSIGRADVTIFGSCHEPEDKDAGVNLATLLTRNNAAHSATHVTQGKNALIDIETEPTVVSNAVMPEPQPVVASLTRPEPTRSYDVDPDLLKYSFSRDSIYQAEQANDGTDYWRDWDDIMGDLANSYDGMDHARSSKDPIGWIKSCDEGYFDTVYGQRDYGGTYNVTRLDTNYCGKAQTTWNDQNEPGDYYDQLLMSFGWVRPGLYKTGALRWNHRVLRPELTVTVGDWSYSHWFGYDTSTGHTKTQPNEWETQYMISEIGGYGSAMDDHYVHDYKWGTPEGPNLNFGEHFEISLRLQYYDAWTSNPSTSLNDQVTTKGMDSLFDVSAVGGHRRVFHNTNENGNGIRLKLFTANDQNENNDFPKIEVDPDSNFYLTLAPEVSIVPGEGGVDTQGNIYVGTKLMITPPGNVGDYRIAQDGVFMVNQNGDKVGHVEANGDGYSCTMIWDGIGEADLNGVYTLCVTYCRQQNITIDVSHSVPDGQTEEDVFRRLLEKTITVQTSVLTDNDGEHTFRTADDTVWDGGSFDQFNKTEHGYTVANIDNFQTICFHQDPQDLIIHEGKSYAGNAVIPLADRDFTKEELIFEFYDADFLDVISPMTVSIDHVEIYYDSDADGEIKGELDKYGVFQVDGPDKFIEQVSGDYPESNFAAVLSKDENGNEQVHQYFMVVFLSTTARSIVPPPGYTGEEKAQLLPAFLSAVTDSLAAAKLTEEQRMYRYIRGNRTDDQPMFGAEASGLRVIEIPLGGDIGELWFDSHKTAVFDSEGKIADTNEEKSFTWTPNFIGNLLVPFDSPSPIIDTNNATGGGVPLAGENPTRNPDGTYAYSEEGLRKINGYLGSFTERSAFAIGIQEQIKHAYGPEGTTLIDSFADIQPETVEIGSVRSVPGAEGVTSTGTADTPGETQGASPQNNSDTNAFKQDLGANLPTLQLGIGDYANIIIEENKIAFSICIPTFSDSKTYGETEETLSNGGTKTTENIEGGTKETYNYQKNGTDVTTVVETVKDPTDPNTRTKTITTETKNGDEKTYRQVTKTQKYEDGEWYLVDEKVRDNKPGLSERAKENFKKTSGYDTLQDFIKACKSDDKDSLGNFMSGTFSVDALRAAKNGKAKTSNRAVTFTVQFAVAFEYNSIDNCLYFKNAGVSAALSVNFTFQARLPACPLLYFYMKVGLDFKASMGFSVYRKATYGSEITEFMPPENDLSALENGGEAIFQLDMTKKTKDTVRGFSLNLNGKVLLEIFDKEDLSGTALASGTISGDGGEQQVLLKEYNKVIYIRIKANDTKPIKASKLRPIIGAWSKWAFDGVTLEPGFSVEIGFGIGVEVLKLEAYAKVSVSIALTLGGYLAETDTYEGFYVSDFKAYFSLGINVSLVLFNFSLDLFSVGSDGKQSGTGGYFTWDSTVTALNDNKKIKEWITYTDALGKPLEDKPVMPQGVNIFKDNTDMHFFRSDGQAADTSKDDQGWTFRTDVQPWRWKGGKFIGETPQNHDLSEADEDNVFVTFTPSPSDIKLYFSGNITVFIGSDTTGKDYKKSPATISAGTDEVKVLLKKGAKLDRYEAANSGEPDIVADPEITEGRSLVRVTGPTDVTGTEKIITPNDNTRAITPGGTSDFQLSGYNTSGDARELVKGLVTGYDYLLVKAGKENYVLYPYMTEEADSKDTQLVVSRLVMTGDLSQGTGLVHPITGGTDPAYLIVDDNHYSDLYFDAVGSDDALLVSWVGFSDGSSDSYEVKQRSIPLTGGELPEIVTLYTGSDPCSLPSVENGGTIWVSASGDGSQDNAKLKAWLLAHHEGLTEEMLEPPYETTPPDLSSAVFQWATQSALNTQCGDSSVLHVKVGDTEETAVIDGEHIHNLETATIGDRIYLLYSATQVVYLDTTNDVPQTVGANGIDAGTERTMIHRLYLRTVDQNGFSPAVCIETVVDHESCTRDTVADSRLRDGVFVGGSVATEQADPYLSNLRFVTAKLDEGEAQTMALFEMGGNTWLLKKEDMDNLLADSSASVELTPIFSETTGTDAVIGSDNSEDGNLAVVYTAPVNDSLSNAIWIAWWDKQAGSWGSPAILAMRDLQIYEDSITYDMTPEQTEKAYLGQYTTPTGATGSMNKLTFSNLQMSTVHIPPEETEDPENGSEAPENEQIIILTTGAITKLRQMTVNGGEALEYDTIATDGAASIGFYAIGFGMGEQAIGEGDLDFHNHDFTIGSRLLGEVGFRNTGTASIRASAANPMTVRLMVTEGGENSPAREIVKWELTESIPSGKATRLYFDSLPLTANLKKNAIFYLDVEENAYFGENGGKIFHGQTEPLFTVEESPELSFSKFELSLLSVKNGIATFDLDAMVINNGSGDAENVFIQFSYDTGKIDDFGNRICNVIDITGSDLKTGEQQLLRRGGTEDMQNGIYRLQGTDGSKIGVGYGRTVTGTLRVPTSCFISEENITGLHLKAEIYSDADTPNLLYSVYSSDHGEYNETNNRSEHTFKHHTAFTVPDRITTALGTTLILPVTFEATHDTPSLMLTEISDGTPDWTPRMGICYYDEERQVIVAAPNSTAKELIDAGKVPTGILQLKDMSTNSIDVITYRITSMAQGVNIYRDDATFTFYDADGQETILYPEETDQPGWSFLDKGVSIGWTGGEPGEIPMNHDLSLSNQDGAYFTFHSVADTMTFYFMGEITVESSLFGTQTFTSSPATMRFDNPTGANHVVKVSAKAGTKIDRFVATYKDDPVVDPDPDAPEMLWNRSFPEIASVQDGDTVPMTCYIIDKSGISSVSFNNQKLSETTEPALVKVSDKLWYFDYTFAENKQVSIRATDIVGNSSESGVNVEWFNSVVSAGANAEAPKMTRDHLRTTDPDGNPVGMTDPKNYTPWLNSTYALEENEESKAYVYADGLFRDTPLDKSDDERWLIGEDGYYQVRVDRSDGTWARAIVQIDGIDLIPPELAVRAEKDGLRINATDNRSLQSVCVNGYPLAVSGSAFKGVFPVAYSGVYTVEAADAAGNTTSTSVQVEIPLAIGDPAVTVDCANGNIQISVIADRSIVTGGEFDPALSEPAQNIYTANYEIVLAPEGTTEAPETGWTALTDSATLTVSEGVYELFVRNGAGETAKHENPLYLYHPISWNMPTYDWVETETGYNVTATTVCELNETHIMTETVVSVGTVKQPATCEMDGTMLYTATFENDLFTTQTKYVPIPAIGHAWGDPVYSWHETEEDGVYAEAISICGHDSSHVLHELVTPEIEIPIPPTCEEGGEVRYTAVFEVELFETQVKTEPIPPMGHKWGTPTYDWVVTGDGYTVTGTTVCEHDPSHVGTETEHATYEIVAPPTTREDGLGRWTAVFTDERFTTQTKDVVLPMLRPTFYGEHLPAVDVAEYADGRTLYRYDVRIRNVDVDWRSVSIQVFVEYDPSILTFAEARTPFTGSVGVNAEDGTVRFAWATDGEAQPLPDGTVVVSLYFAAAGPIADGTVAEIVFKEGTGLSYLNEAGGTVEADPVLYENGSITFSIPDLLTFAGEDVFANDVWIIENGEMLYRYDVRLEDLPEPGLLVTSAQIFLHCDGTKLVFRRAAGPVDWTATEKNGKLLFAWASEAGVLLHDDDIVLTLWFAKGDGVQPGDRVGIAFTANALGYPSSVSFLFADKVTEVEAATIDGSITFEAPLYGDANCDGMITAADAALILRSIVGLSALSPRGTLNADVDGDGEVTAADAAMILRYVVGLIASFPAENP